jgi:hypothetical protein
MLRDFNASPSSNLNNIDLALQETWKTPSAMEDAECFSSTRWLAFFAECTRKTLGD